jgi:hypothetical protein
MARRRKAAETSKRLVDGGRLYYTLVGKLRVRRRGNGESWWGSLSSRARGCVGAALKWILVLSSIVVLRALATVLLALLNNLPLPFPNINASLQLFSHSGILGVEAGRQTCESDVLHDGGTVL